MRPLQSKRPCCLSVSWLTTRISRPAAPCRQCPLSQRLSFQGIVSHIKETRVHLNLGKTYLFEEAHAVRENVQVEGEFPPGKNKETVLLSTRERRGLIQIVESLGIKWDFAGFALMGKSPEWLLNLWWVACFVSQSLFSRCCASSTQSPSCLLSAVWSHRSARQTAQR